MIDPLYCSRYSHGPDGIQWNSTHVMWLVQRVALDCRPGFEEQQRHFVRIPLAAMQAMTAECTMLLPE